MTAAVQFDFDKVHPRLGTDSLKWQKYQAADILPLWIADMDFQAAPSILTALHSRIDHGMLGYAAATQTTTQAVVDYVQTHYDWCIDPAWIVWLPGVVSGLYVAAQTFAQPGEQVLCHTPVYPPFHTTPPNAGRRLQCIPFAYDSSRRSWEIDFEALTNAITPHSRMFFLCNPHNPIGRVFNRQELLLLSEFCLRHQLILVSDEIHCDLILDAKPHVPAGALGAEFLANTITLMSPSKAFNLAGLCTAFAIISDANLRQRYVAAGRDMLTDVGPLGYTGCTAAYREGHAWRMALLDYLRANRDLLQQVIARDCPGIKLEAPIEATFLAWLNVGALGKADPVTYFESHGIGLSDGVAFGARRGQYVRLNFGCPRATLTEALRRLTAAARAA